MKTVEREKRFALPLLTRERAGYLFFSGAIVYLASVLWVNFHGSQWYNFDMYADAYVARLMAEQRTLFPADWIFGNQYYVVATPVLTALLQLLTHESVLSMALASSLMTLLTLAAFFWCCRPFFRRESLAVGLFCLSGAVLLGTSASSCINSFQLFYTMASYYACYVIGILLPLGLYLRLRQSMRVSPAAIAGALLLNFALGMQSLRETLILNIPLLLLEALCWRRHGFSKRAAFFALLCLIANLAGVGLMRMIPVSSSAITGQLRFLNGGLSAGLLRCLKDLVEITGLQYLSYSWKWRGLFAFSLVFWGAAILALLQIVRRRDFSPAALPVVFCILSLSCLLAVGVLLFPTRPRYYFVWFLLLAFSFSYLAQAYPGGTVKRFLLAALLLCGVGNYIYNFYPDYKKYPAEKAFFEELADGLLREGVDCLYVDLFTMPTLAACAGDAVVCGTFEYDFSESPEHFFSPVPHLQHSALFAHPEQRSALVVLSDSQWSACPSWAFIEQNAPRAYLEALRAQLIPVGSAETEYYTLYFYRFKQAERMFG